MKQFFIIFLVFILAVSTCQKRTNLTDNSKMVSYDDTLSRRQLDSLFIADTLSFNIENEWIQSMVVTEDKRSALYKYVYIKEITDSTQVIYTLCSYQDTLYIINKRVVE